MRKQFLLVALLVVALRLPFLNQAIQGDDLYYLYGAEHAQIDPLHPNHARYAFLGQMVDMRGHPHPPLDAWYLGALLAIFGEIREAPFHAGYLPFSLIAVWSALVLARRFTPRPLLATALFVVTPAFVVNGTSLESDLPFVAFWLASIALFVVAVDRRSIGVLALACAAMAVAAMAAYQSIVLTPILALYIMMRRRDWTSAWIAALTPVVALAVWQLWERSTSGALPASVLAGYMHTYNLQAFSRKVQNAAALTGHLGWVLFPLVSIAAFRGVRRWAWLFTLLVAAAGAWADPHPLYWASAAVGALVLAWCIEHRREWLAASILIFFGCALILFFAGSARYLLPIAAPLAILASARVSPRWLYAGMAAELALSFLLATVNYQHWDGYRRFARALEPEMQNRRVWIDGEWGLRFYLESQGALPLLVSRAPQPSEMIVTSVLASSGPVPATGASVGEAAITSRIPLRLTALGARSGYSSIAFGLRPFDLSLAPMDIVKTVVIQVAQPDLEDLPMNSPKAEHHIISGVYGLEQNQWRWMGAKAVLALKAPQRPTPLAIDFFIPDLARARRITLLLNNRVVAEQTYPGPGHYTLKTAPLEAPGIATVTITVDQTFSVPGDNRRLGVILTKAGFQ